MCLYQTPRSLFIARPCNINAKILKMLSRVSKPKKQFVMAL